MSTSIQKHKKWKRAALALLMLAGGVLVYNQSSVNISRVDEAKFIIGQLNAVLDSAKLYAHETGTLPPITSDTDPKFGYLNINNLIENPGLSAWQGPYLPYSDTWIGGDQYISHPDYLATQLLLKEKNSQWARGSSETGCQSSSSACTLAACIWLVPIKVAQEINKIVDGDVSTENSDPKGKVRYDKAFWGALVCLLGDDYPMPSK